MSPTSSQRKRVINNFPLPIAYAYQELIYQSVQDRDTDVNGDGSSAFLWSLLRNIRIALSTMGILATCDYLNLRHKLSHRNLNRILFDNISSPSEEGWHAVLVSLLDHFSYRAEKEGKYVNRLPELLQLAQKDIPVDAPPVDFPVTIYPERLYSCLEILEILITLRASLATGPYRLTIPPRRILDYGFQLFEKSIQRCIFLENYGIYVLVGKDERKTRGFLCKGTRSLPVGIKGISSEKWHFFKGRPFLAPPGHKNYISLFPFMVPWLQKFQDRTGFSDLLLYDQSKFGGLNYFSYRQLKLIDYKNCATGALAFIQKELHWLQAHAVKVSAISSPILDFEDLVISDEFDTEKRNTLVHNLSTFTAKHESGYISWSGKFGYGKTSTLAALYKDTCRTYKTKPDDQEIPDVLFIWHFCSSLEQQDYSIVVLKSLYGQVLEKLFQETRPQVNSKVQKLPGNLENLHKNFLELLQRGSEEVLIPNNWKLVVMIDAMDEIASDKARSILAFLPFSLPKNIFVLLGTDENYLNNLRLSLLAKQLFPCTPEDAEHSFGSIYTLAAPEGFKEEAIALLLKKQIP